MKPPPPRFPANGYVTARANAVATAASTAFPPRDRISAPMSDEISVAETTTPAGAGTPTSALFRAGGAVWPSGGATTKRAARTVAVRLRIGGRVHPEGLASYVLRLTAYVLPAGRRG